MLQVESVRGGLTFGNLGSETTLSSRQPDVPPLWEHSREIMSAHGTRRFLYFMGRQHGTGTTAKTVLTTGRGIYAPSTNRVLTLSWRGTMLAQLVHGVAAVTT